MTYHEPTVMVHTPKAVAYHEPTVMVYTPKAVTYHEPTVMVYTPKAVTYHEPTVMRSCMIGHSLGRMEGGGAYTVHEVDRVTGAW